MELFLFLLVSLAALVAGQDSLMQVLSENLELTTLHQYVNASANLTRLFSSLNGVTLLAPSNAAFASLLQSRDENTISDADIEVLLQYHILNGSFPVKSFSSVPQFVPTYLNDPKYTNVTTGQVVELVTDNDGSPQILSWNKTVAAITTPDVSCNNGLIQVISEVLTVPLAMGTLLLTANFKYFVAGLYEVGIYNTSSFDPVAYDVNATDVTFFVPNTAAALVSFTDVTSNATNMTNVLDILKYHIVVGDLVYSPEFENGMQLTTANGKNITISKEGDIIFVNQARIITPDYIVSNGVVHVIDGLLDDLFVAIETPPPTATPATPSNAGTGTSKSSSGGLSTTAKIAIGVTFGILIPLLLAGALLYYFLRIRRSAIVTDENDAPPERKRSYVHNADARGNKVNRVLGQDLQLDPPLLSNERFVKANIAELDSMPMRSPSLSGGTVVEVPKKGELES